MTENDAELRGRFSRWWWVPDWLWHGVAIFFTGLLLKKIGEKVLKLNFRSILVRVGRYALKSVPLIVPMTFGFAFMEQYVAYLGTPLFLRIGIGLVGVVAVWVLVLRRRAQHNLDGILTLNKFSSGLSEGVGLGFNFVIGGVLKAFFILVVGLFPYASNPWVLIIYGVYGLFLFSVVLMKRIASKVGGRYLRKAPKGIWI